VGRDLGPVHFHHLSTKVTNTRECITMPYEYAAGVIFGANVWEFLSAT
jgi:hypothetical protein